MGKKLTWAHTVGQKRKCCQVCAQRCPWDIGCSCSPWVGLSSLLGHHHVLLSWSLACAASLLLALIPAPRNLPHSLHSVDFSALPSVPTHMFYMGIQRSSPLNNSSHFNHKLSTDKEIHHSKTKTLYIFLFL